jgi:hypothetical protein
MGKFSKPAVIKTLLGAVFSLGATAAFSLDRYLGVDFNPGSRCRELSRGIIDSIWTFLISLRSFWRPQTEEQENPDQNHQAAEKLAHGQ